MRPGSRLLGIARAVGAQRGYFDREVRSRLFERVLDHRVARKDARDGRIIAGRARGNIVAQRSVCADDEVCARRGLGGRGNLDGLFGETGVYGHRQQYGCCETRY